MLYSSPPTLSLSLSSSVSDSLLCTISSKRVASGVGSHCGAVVAKACVMVTVDSPGFTLFAANHVSMPCFKPLPLPSLGIGRPNGKISWSFLTSVRPVRTYSCAAGHPRTRWPACAQKAQPSVFISQKNAEISEPGG